MDPIKLFGGVVAAHDEMVDPNSNKVEIIESIRVMTKKFIAGFNHRILEEKLVEYSGSGMLMKFYENAGRIDPVILCCQSGYLDLLKYIYENNARYRAKINRSAEYTYQAYYYNQPEVLEWLMDTSTPNTWESQNFVNRSVKVSIQEHSYNTLKIMEATQLMEYDPFDYFITMDKRGQNPTITFEDLRDYLRNYDLTLAQLDYLFQEFKSQEVVLIYLRFKGLKRVVFEKFQGRVNFDEIFDHPVPHLQAMDYENIARELCNQGLDLPRYFSKAILTNIAYIWDLPEYFPLCENYLIGQFAVDYLFEHEKYELLERLGSPTPVNVRNCYFNRVELAVPYFFRPGFDKQSYLVKLTRQDASVYNRFIATCTPEQHAIVEQMS